MFRAGGGTPFQAEALLLREKLKPTFSRRASHPPASKAIKRSSRHSAIPRSVERLPNLCQLVDGGRIGRHVGPRGIYRTRVPCPRPIGPGSARELDILAPVTGAVRQWGQYGLEQGTRHQAFGHFERDRAPWRTILAPIFTSLSRSVVMDHCATSGGTASVRRKLPRLSASGCHACRTRCLPCRDSCRTSPHVRPGTIARSAD